MVISCPEFILCPHALLTHLDNLITNIKEEVRLLFTQAVINSAGVTSKAGFQTWWGSTLWTHSWQSLMCCRSQMSHSYRKSSVSLHCKEKGCNGFNRRPLGSVIPILTWSSKTQNIHSTQVFKKMPHCFFLRSFFKTNVCVALFNSPPLLAAQCWRAPWPASNTKSQI